MYERFLERAIKVMQTANREAKRFNHEYIGTEHILLGLIKDKDCVAMQALKRLGISVKVIRQEVVKLVQSEPEIITMGKLPQTPRAQKVIEYAMEEARKLNHNYVGTEHLLLGLMREFESVAGQVLMKLGLTIEKAREAVVAILNQSPRTAEGPDVEFTLFDVSSQAAVEPSLDQLKIIEELCEDAGISRALFLRILRRPGKVGEKCLADATEVDFANAAHWCARQGIVKSLQEIANWPGWKKQGVTGQPE